MNIKVCGITSSKQLNQLNSLKVDYAGFTFCKNSPRYIDNQIKPVDLDNEDFDIKKVGVFMNEEFHIVQKIIDEYHLDLVQLNGNESPQYCKKLSDIIEVIKVIHITDDVIEIIDAIELYDDSCDYYLFDSSIHSNKSSGDGEKFNWEMLHEINIEKPFFLGGDISISDIDALLQFSHPDLMAVDINNQFEISPGEKDMALVLKFVHAVKYNK